jgi:hypothetical protein
MLLSIISALILINQSAANPEAASKRSVDRAFGKGTKKTRKTCQIPSRPDVDRNIKVGEGMVNRLDAANEVFDPSAGQNGNSSALSSFLEKRGDQQ